MIKSDYWDIKPHTQRKLEILEKYLNSWCDIIFSYSKKNPNWKAWQTPYYVDCFSGKGMYHSGTQKNIIKGSPVIAIEKFIEKKKQFESTAGFQINPKIRLIEFNKKYSEELTTFVKPYEIDIDIKIINDDFNDVIASVITEMGTSPAFFFVDAGGIKELKSESVERIVSKKGARDILLNYVVNGQIRIGGLAKSVFDGTYKGDKIEDVFKNIERLEDFTGLSIYDFLEETDNDYKEALLNYVSNVLHANNKLNSPEDRLQTIVYDMKDLKRQKLVYYLLFSSRKSVATDVMKSIFKNSKKKESNQISMFEPNVLEINK